MHNRFSPLQTVMTNLTDLTPQPNAMWKRHVEPTGDT
jgi:hypothetical protein